MDKEDQSDASLDHSDPQTDGTSGADPLQAQSNKQILLVTVNKDNTTIEVTETSASEDQLQEAVMEQKWLSAPKHTFTQMFSHSTQRPILHKTV